MKRDLLMTFCGWVVECLLRVQRIVVWIPGLLLPCLTFCIYGIEQNRKSWSR